MELTSTEFHKQAFNIITTAVEGARDQGLEIETMPPHLSIIESEQILCEEGHLALAISCKLPEILQDVDPTCWSWIARTLMSESENSEGFVFWCLVESEHEDNLIHGLSYQKGGDFNAFLCDTNFKNLRSVEPFIVVPYLEDDYEQEMVVH